MTRPSQPDNRMQIRRRVDWGFRLGLLVCLAVAAGWGFLLGLALVRVNEPYSRLGVVGAALPIAFAGSMATGLAFRRLWRGWPRAARLLVALLVTAAAMPVGLAWGIYVQQLDAFQLFDTTGPLPWNAEWMIAIVGLVAGMWPGWTAPFFRLAARIPGFSLEAAARFFETLGHAFLWAPTKVWRRIQTEARDVRRTWNSRPTPARPAPPSPVAAPPSRPASSAPPRIKSGRRLPKLNLPRARRRARTGEGPRVVGIVEDRCPYCFDIVKRNDPRGVRICPVCGAPHHADCWAITGKCQVPHLNT